MADLTGRITNIQNYCVHDGPNIRTVVFMKGCPLRCKWCSNPETQDYNPNLAYSRMKCIGCGACIQGCPNQAISPDDEGKIRIDYSRCVGCYTCTKTCYAKALHVFGEDVTVSELFKRTNSNYAWRANGGITVSGGEVLMQADFVAEFLKRHRAIGTSTAIETCGFAPWESLEKVAAQCHLVFFDVKHLDAKKHKELTGQDNALILENLKRLSANFPNVDIIVRTPVVEGMNDSREELEQICDFLAGLPHLTDYELLPYHGFGAPKYAQIGKQYELESMRSMDKARVRELNRAFRQKLNLPLDPA